MALQRGMFVLRNRYKLTKPLISEDFPQASESWLAEETTLHTQYLLRLWTFESEEAIDLQRALWDLELRKLYRITSSPSAERSLFQIHDVGLDHERNCFVMVLTREGFGFESLHNALVHR